jgi:hypothetical protein
MVCMTPDLFGMRGTDSLIILQCWYANLLCTWDTFPVFYHKPSTGEKAPNPLNDLFRGIILTGNRFSNRIKTALGGYEKRGKRNDMCNKARPVHGKPGHEAKRNGDLCGRYQHIFSLVDFSTAIGNEVGSARGI